MVEATNSMDNLDKIFKLGEEVFHMGLKENLFKITYKGYIKSKKYLRITMRPNFLDGKNNLGLEASKWVEEQKHLEFKNDRWIIIQVNI